MANVERSYLPEGFLLEPELLEQLSSRPGHQRCVDGQGELLLVVHDVPKPGVPERQAVFFWKTRENCWISGGQRKSLGDLDELLSRYERAIDAHEEVIDEADTAVEIFTILRHAGPLARTSRNLLFALNQVLAIDPDDREMRLRRDRAVEVERAADLLFADAKTTLEFWQATRSEEQAESAERLNIIAFRLNLLAGFFLPLVALGGLFGMNVSIPEKFQPHFWTIFFLGLGTGAVLLFFVAWQRRGQNLADRKSEERGENLRRSHGENE